MPANRPTVGSALFGSLISIRPLCGAEPIVGRLFFFSFFRVKGRFGKIGKLQSNLS
jgi:hypothetical protein